MKKFISPRMLALIGIPVAVSFLIGFNSRPSDQYFEISKNLDIFGKMYREVQANYVDDIEPGEFMRTGIDAMLNSLDPYTNFISASEIEDFRFMSTGQYGGIGAVVTKRDNKVIISEPYEGYPAVSAGLRAGDEILKIDDLDMSSQDVVNLDVRNLLRGAPDSKVKLTLRRGNDAPFTVELNRADVKIKNVPFYGMIDAETGYISLTGFTQAAAQEVGAAFTKLKEENPGMKSLVLDLRGNPGGLLHEAVGICNLFIPQGEKVVETRGRIEGSYHAYFAEKPALDTEMPVAVLINSGSASASEIVSGTIQDLDRGVVVGRRSYGKGLVQNPKPLSFNTQIKITTAKYYTPSGRCIQALDYSHRNPDGSVGKVPDSLVKPFKTRAGRTVYDGGGIAPDVEVKDPEYHAALVELIRQNHIFDFATEYRNTHESIPSAREFRLSDEDYTAFVEFVKKRGFKYTTQTEKGLDSLKKLMQKEAYFDDLHTDISAIEKRIQTEKSNDLISFKKEISAFLRSEIVSRYYYRSGTIEAGFDSDPDVTEAVKVLKDQAKYKSILIAK